MKLLERWKEGWFYPVAVNLSTALILFLVMLCFTPIREWLLPTKPIGNYPLICAAEAYPGEAEKQLIVDFFIINTDAEHEYSRNTLDEILKKTYPDSDISLSPDLELPYYRHLGQIDTVYVDREFNADKGDLATSVDRDRNSVQIKVNHIRKRAILKVTILVSGLPDASTAVRSSKVSVPFEFKKLEEACYTRP